MHWMGRMEEIRQDIYIDGAHNEDGIEAFVESIEAAASLRENNKCVVVFSVVKDKQYDKMIHMLCKLDFVTDFILTHIPGQRGANLEELSGWFREYCGDKAKIYTYENIEDAIIQSLALKGKSGRVYIVGSLYLAGIVEDIFRRQI
jgi:dihydrofolate synthase/folylpolyglutamate synthase